MFHVVCSTDNCYAPYCGTMLCSLLTNNIYEFHIHVLYDDLSDENRLKLSTLVTSKHQSKCFFYNLCGFDLHENQVEGCRNLSKSAYYRLLLVSILPTDIEKVLYLDCDIIVCGDISYLWKIDLENYAVAAISDLKIMPLNGIHSQTLSMSYDLAYFNSGFMLVNLSYWRRYNLERRLLTFLKTHIVVFHDQDALNYVLKGKWFMLPPQACCLNMVLYKLLYFKTKKDFYEYRKNRKVIHFVSDLKPWHDLLCYPNKNLFISYLNLTPWADTFEPVGVMRCTHAYLRMLNIIVRNYYFRIIFKLLN